MLPAELLQRAHGEDRVEEVVVVERVARDGHVQQRAHDGGGRGAVLQRRQQLLLRVDRVLRVHGTLQGSHSLLGAGRRCGRDVRHGDRPADRLADLDVAVGLSGAGDCRQGEPFGLVSQVLHQPDQRPAAGGAVQAAAVVVGDELRAAVHRETAQTKHAV